MPRPYSPRRARARWLEDAPAYVLDVFDHGSTAADRYTVVFKDGPHDSETAAHYLGMSEDPAHPTFGCSTCGVFRAHELAAYRHRNARSRTRWLDLPEAVRRHVGVRFALAYY